MPRVSRTRLSVATDQAFDDRARQKARNAIKYSNNSKSKHTDPYLVSHAGHVAHGIFAVNLVVAVVVKPAVGGAPALEAPLGGHVGGA